MAWMKYLADRARVSRLSTEQLRLIVAKPANLDFRFAFAELSMRGIDMGIVQQSLVDMLVSSDDKERCLGLERLRDICPGLRHVYFEESPRDLQALVQVILERKG